MLVSDSGLLLCSTIFSLPLTVEPGTSNFALMS